MNSATTKTSAIDHLAIVSTKASVRARLWALARNVAHATRAALLNGTITLNSRIRMAAV